MLFLISIWGSKYTSYYIMQDVSEYCFGSKDGKYAFRGECPARREAKPHSAELSIGH